MTRFKDEIWRATSLNGDKEIIEKYVMLKEQIKYNQKKNYGYENCWYSAWQNEALAISMAKDRRKYNIGANDLLIRDILLARMEFGNTVRVNQSALARDIDMHVSMVNTSLKKLCYIGFIEKIEDEYGYPYYKVNSGYAFKGDSKNFTKAESLND